MKKAQGISMNTIVVAAIALLVLVVLIAIFSGRMGVFNKDLEEQTAGKKCAEFLSTDKTPGVWKTGASCGTGLRAVFGSISDSGNHPGQVCCIKDN